MYHLLCQFSFLKPCLKVNILASIHHINALLIRFMAIKYFEWCMPQR
jgi:hypothetical protein